MSDRETFRKNLSELMRTAKITQVDLAKYAAVSQRTVSAWVCGRGYPRAETMEKLCKFFNVRQSALIENHDAEQTPEDRMLLIYRALPAKGKEKLLERAEELKVLYIKRKKVY